MSPLALQNKRVIYDLVFSHALGAAEIFCDPDLSDIVTSDARIVNQKLEHIQIRVVVRLDLSQPLSVHDAS